MPNPQAIPDTATREIYLDNNATTRPLREVRESMLGALGEHFGNPSSAHSTGERGREHLRRARASVADLIHADAESIVFTSSGTESNNLALHSGVALRAPGRIVTTAVEHSSILKDCEFLARQGVEVVLLPVNRAGLIDLDELEATVTPETAMVSVQWVNNETGVIQDLETISAICSSTGVHLHTDACQAVGKILVDVTRTPVDFLTLTAHKFHGPQGVGALYAKDPSQLQPTIHGGSQEGGLRAGTENLSGIVGFGKAAELRHERLSRLQIELAELRVYFEQRVLALLAKVEINGDTNRRACNTTNLLFRGVDGEALVARLDQEGIRCSQSSACTNQRPEASYVLTAMGLSEEEAYSSVRFSVSEETTKEDLDVAAETTARLCTQLRRFHSRRRLPSTAEVSQ